MQFLVEGFLRKESFQENLVKKEIESMSRYSRAQKAAVEEMSSINLNEREKRMSTAKIG